jgi:hypothetical protein
MATTATQMAAYLYPDEEDSEGAFSWWLSPCGGTDLVPDNIKKLFGILSQVANGVSSFTTPKDPKKGSGKKGDGGNPKDQSKPQSLKNNNNIGGSSSSKKKCKIQGTKTEQKSKGFNTLRMSSCNQKDETETVKYIINTMEYSANAQTLQVSKTCSAAYPQACYHYSSVIRQNPSWATLTCPNNAATVKKVRKRGAANSPQATKAWQDKHKGGLGKDKAGIKDNNFKGTC